MGLYLQQRKRFIEVGFDIGFNLQYNRCVVSYNLMFRV